MLAPQAERLESGEYLNLCLQSRAMYSGWIESIESLAGVVGSSYASSRYVLARGFDKLTHLDPFGLQPGPTSSLT